MITLDSVKYELFILLSKKEFYEGKVLISFRLTDKSIVDLFLDFHGLSIKELIVNDTLISD